MFPNTTQVPNRHRGRLNDSLIAPREVKRSRGGQPGNQNARRHRAPAPVSDIVISMINPSV